MLRKICFHTKQPPKQADPYSMVQEDQLASNLKWLKYIKELHPTALFYLSQSYNGTVVLVTWPTTQSIQQETYFLGLE